MTVEATEQVSKTGPAQTPELPHVILCGSAQERDMVVPVLNQMGGIHLSLYERASITPSLYLFETGTFKKVAETLDDIGVESAVYTFEPAAMHKSPTDEDTDTVAQESIRQALQDIVDGKLIALEAISAVGLEASAVQAAATKMEACLDQLLSGPTTWPEGDPQIAPKEDPGISPDTRPGISPKEDPGISPGGTPRWLEHLPAEASAVIAEIDWSVGLQIRDLPGMESTAETESAIIILDSSPRQLNTWAFASNAQEQVLDGWADFQHLLLRSPEQKAKHLDEIRKAAIPVTATRGMLEAQRQAVERHGLMVAAICRRLAPEGTPIYLLRVQDEDGIGNLHALTSALRYALYLRKTGTIRARHLIFNLSLGIPATSREGVDSAHLLNAINDVLRAENTFVVAAAGNTGVWDPKHAAASLALTARDASLAERRNVLAKVLQDPDAGGTYGWQGVAQDVPESNGAPPEEQDDVLGPRRVPAEEPAAYHKLREELAVEPNRSSYHGHAPDDLDADLFQRRLFCVGASDQFDYTAIETAAFAPFSNRAPLVAPGLNVMLTSPDNGSNRFLIWNGTSFATPQVAGLVARMLAAGCPPDEIAAILLGSGAPSTRLRETSTESKETSRRSEEEYRHVDPHRALSCASAPDAF